MAHRTEDEKFRARCISTPHEGSQDYQVEGLRDYLEDAQDQEVIMGDFNWRGDMAMQKVLMGTEYTEDDAENVTLKARADKRDEDIFSALPWRLHGPKTRLGRRNLEEDGLRMVAKGLAHRRLRHPRSTGDGGHRSQAGDRARMALQDVAGQAALKRHWTAALTRRGGAAQSGSRDGGQEPHRRHLRSN